MFGTVRAVRVAASLIASVLVYLMVPHSVGLTLDAVHLLTEGHSRHADGDNGHEAPGPEHGCSGPYHHCVCHSSLPLAPGARATPEPAPAPAGECLELEEARAPAPLDLDGSERPPAA